MGIRNEKLGNVETRSNTPTCREVGGFLFVQVANMPCYVVEHIWHVLFGEDDTLPWRSEDVRRHWHSSSNTMQE